MNDQWIDFDFTKDERFTGGDLGRNPNAKPCRAFETTMAAIPESLWRTESEKLDEAGGGLERLVVSIFDQGQEGSCVGNASTQLHQVMQAAQFGKNRVVRLSPISLYKQIGSSPSSGAMIDDALEAGTETGILPLDTSENKQRFQATMSATGFRQTWPANWKETAKLFRFDEFTVVESLGGMMTALFRGFPVVVGRDGHSILYLRPVWKNNQWMIKYVNSWSEEWGEGFGLFPGGFGYDSLRLVKESAQWAFTCRSILAPDMFDLSV